MLSMALRIVKDGLLEIHQGTITLARLKVFPMITILHTQLRVALNNLRYGTENIVDGCITSDRIQSVLVLEEYVTHTSRQIDKSQAVCISNGTFVWNVLQPEVKKERKKFRDTLRRRNREDEKERERLHKEEYEEILHNINFSATKGSLVGVCGTVGSGKSSLLLACLGQMKMISGQLCRSGTCAYVSQQAWILNSTLRENILFGETFDANRYYHVLYCCALNDDINLLPGGDETEIGERGVNLSGGQKQRVALARALYSDREIYFLDDPLSAVDTQVGVHIFEKCIQSALSKKTVILVTHQIQYLQKCDEIFVLKDGKIVERGTHNELVDLDQEYKLMVQSANIESKSEETNSVEATAGKIPSPPTANETLPNKKNDGKTLITAETQETGEVNAVAYHSYISAAGGYCVSFLVILAILLSVGSNSFSAWWLALWIKAGSGNTTVFDPATNETVISQNINDNPDLDFYVQIYAGTIGLILVTSLLRGVIFTKATIRASKVIHRKLFDKVMGAPMKYFETTPIGRIQNLFSRDLDEVDARLPSSVETLLQSIWVVMFSFLFISLVFPWFIVPLALLAVLYYFISKIFRVAVRDFKRLENISRAPIFSSLTATVQGLTTIHAFNKEGDFIARFSRIFDENATCMYLSCNSMRWMATRLDSLSVTISCITAVLAVFLKDQVAPALAGLALTYAAHISGVFQYTIRLMSETETRFISVERIQTTVETLEVEGDRPIHCNPPVDWPSKGSIKFYNVRLQYRSNAPDVLKEITFHIKPGEKLGVVGRTGAGKSSLAAALFRLVELTSGRITIDGLDISGIDLHILRSRLSVIPQDPVLFSGTFRANLDPFDVFKDEQLWETLRKTKLSAKVESMEGRLSAVVGENGENLSVGERQLVCLARALLRGNKILILDEATAAVDPETEAAIQTTIENEFTYATVITIAHRLTTVTSCNRILVMDQGMGIMIGSGSMMWDSEFIVRTVITGMEGGNNLELVVELDSPLNLMSDPNSEFSKMAAATGIQLCT